MTATHDSWLLLIVSLPTTGATARMRVWRAVKTLGCAALRDGAYLLPTHAEQAPQLREHADEAVQENGQAWLLHVQAQAPDEATAYQALFDRTPVYTEWLAELAEARKTLPGRAVAELNRLHRRHAGGFEAILAGARKRIADDDALLAQIGVVLDSLYAHFFGNRKT